MTNLPSLSLAADFWRGILCPGIQYPHVKLAQIIIEVQKRWDVLLYKQSQPYLWIVFVGGTGTGKSTIFNTLCGMPLSDTGVERPKTRGPIAYVHQNVPVEKDFPFPEIGLKRIKAEPRSKQGQTGQPGEILILEHDRQELAHLILVDTPDFDSIENHHRKMAEDLYLLSDIAVFVTSQEKYADKVPYEFLQNMQEDERTYFFLLNKANQQMTRQDVLTIFLNHNFQASEERIWLIPNSISHLTGVLPREEHFANFSRALQGLCSPEKMPLFLIQETRRKAGALKKRLELLLSILELERQAARQWLSELEKLFEHSCQKFLEAQRERFSSQSRTYLQSELRKLFSKYDLLARPRRAVFRILTAPIWLFTLGRKKDNQALQQKDLLKLRDKMDLSPVRIALDQFNRKVLEDRSPPDQASPLYRDLRKASILITKEEALDMIQEEQNRMFLWLQETFQNLAKGIPKSKEWGIYSTSILWGIFILSFEAAIGGGIGLLEAALDSLLAPFVTKGTVELFAYQELQKIAHELADRYQESLLKVLREQRDRYVTSLESLITNDATIKQVENMKAYIERLAAAKE